MHNRIEAEHLHQRAGCVLGDQPRRLALDAEVRSERAGRLQLPGLGGLAYAVGDDGFLDQLEAR
jgi:hypothetical protein